MHAAAVENHELIAIARGQVEIMDSHQRHCPAGYRKSLHIILKHTAAAEHPT